MSYARMKSAPSPDRSADRYQRTSPFRPLAMVCSASARRSGAMLANASICLHR